MNEFEAFRKEYIRLTNNLSWYYFNYFANRLHQNIVDDVTSYIIVYGDQGSGKSSFTFLVAEYLKYKYNYDFDVKRHYVDSLKKFVNLFEKEEQIIVLDEAGVMVSNRRAMSQVNVVIMKFLQMARFRHNILFFNLPHYIFLDKAIRYMANFAVKVKLIRTPETKYRAFQIQVKQITENEKVKFVPASIIDPTKGRAELCPFIKFPNPAWFDLDFIQDDYNEYLKVKERFFRNRQEEVYKLLNLEAETSTKKSKYEEIIRALQSNKKYWIDDKTINWDLVFSDFNIPRGSRSYVKKMVLSAL